MKVEISVNDTVIWMRDSVSLEGTASTGYVKDGTQQKIIAALEDALFQAKGQQLCWDDTERAAISQAAEARATFYAASFEIQN